VVTATRSPTLGWATAVIVGALLVTSLAADRAGAATTATTLARASRYPFAGYITDPSTVTSVSATVTVPTFTCTKRGSTAVTGMATVFDPTGQTFSSGAVYVGCSAKKELVAALVDVDNTFTVPTVNVNPGDTVALSVTCGPSGIAVSVDDQTTSSTGTGSSSTAETCTQGEVGDGAVVNSKGSGLVPLPPFGALDYTAVTVNGAVLTTSTSGAANYSEGKKNMITTGPLVSGAFTTTQGP
jgi:hypothetical protein